MLLFLWFGCFIFILLVFLFLIYFNLFFALRSFLFRDLLFYVFFQLLSLLYYLLEVVIAVFVCLVVLQHFVLFVVAGLVVESSQETDHKQRQVDPKCLSDRNWSLCFHTVHHVTLAWESTQEVSPSAHECVGAN